MKVILNRDYSAEKLSFIERNRCEIVSEIRFSSIAFTEEPCRIIRYCGTYATEIEDDGELCWAVLGKGKAGINFWNCFLI